MIGRARWRSPRRAGFFVDEACHPQNIAVMQTAGRTAGHRDHRGRAGGSGPRGRVSARFSSIRAPMGHLRDVSNEIAALHLPEKAVAIVATDLFLALTLDPGSRAAMDADIAVGVGAAFRRAAGLWRAACRLYFLSRLDEACLARSDRRRVGGQPRAEGLPGCRCRRGSSIYAAKRRPRTCARRKRFCRHRQFLLCGVPRSPLGLRAIAERSAQPRPARLGAAPSGRRSFEPEAQAYFDTLTVPVGERQSRIMAAAWRAGINLRDVGGRPHRHSRWTRTTTEADL